MNALTPDKCDSHFKFMGYNVYVKVICNKIEISGEKYTYYIFTTYMSPSTTTCTKICAKTYICHLDVYMSLCRDDSVYY